MIAYQSEIDLYESYMCARLHDSSLIDCTPACHGLHVVSSRNKLFWWRPCHIPFPPSPFCHSCIVTVLPMGNTSLAAVHDHAEVDWESDQWLKNLFGSNCVKEKELTRMLLGGFVCQSPQILKGKVTEEQPPSGKVKKLLFQDHPWLSTFPKQIFVNTFELCF